MASIFRTTWCILAIVLLTGNIAALLPAGLTWALFLPHAMSLMELKVDRDILSPRSLLISDSTGLIIDRDTTLIELRPWPIRKIEAWIELRRIKHLVRVSKIDLYVRHLEGEERLWGSWRASDIWRPTDTTPVRFLLREQLLTMPQGRYEVRVELHADAPWGVVTTKGERTASVYWGANREVMIPGEFAVWFAATDPVSIEITETSEERFEELITKPAGEFEQRVRRRLRR
jgi:hypothetical protein